MHQYFVPPAQDRILPSQSPNLENEGGAIDLKPAFTADISKQEAVVEAFKVSSISMLNVCVERELFSMHGYPMVWLTHPSQKLTSLAFSRDRCFGFR